jgi:hypothetical protein
MPGRMFIGILATMGFVMIVLVSWRPTGWSGSPASSTAVRPVRG